MWRGVEFDFIPLQFEGVPNGRGSSLPRSNYPVAARHPFKVKGNLRDLTRIYYDFNSCLGNKYAG